MRAVRIWACLLVMLLMLAVGGLAMYQRLQSPTPTAHSRPDPFLRLAIDCTDLDQWRIPTSGYIEVYIPESRRGDLPRELFLKGIPLDLGINAERSEAKD